MRTTDLIGSAVSNTFRSKTRTILTILAIFVGAFTLTLTSGLGTGINAYITDTLSGIGASDAMTVTKAHGDTDGFSATAPREYDPDAVATDIPGMTVIALTPADIDTLESTDGVLRVDPVRTITPDYVQAGDGTQLVASVGGLIPGQSVILDTGAQPDPGTSELEAVLPIAYVEPLGLGTSTTAIGQTVTIAITDAARTQHRIEATVVGIAEQALAGPSGDTIIVNDALGDALFTAQVTGIPDDQADRYVSATVWFDPDATDAEIQQLKDALADQGFAGVTIADQLGMITTVIDGIVLVLNAFAIIALIAAAFGIVNTLYMSVQERTREIGLMKAMGMGSSRVFTLFSVEAAFLGLLGSAIGAGVAMIAGTLISSALADGFLADLPGLRLIAFDPASIATIIVLVMVIAFISGTLPAARAAKADPVDSLRYE